MEIRTLARFDRLLRSRNLIGETILNIKSNDFTDIRVQRSLLVISVKAVDKILWHFEYSETIILITRR